MATSLLHKPAPAPSTGRPGPARLVAWCRSSLAEPLLSVLFPPRCVGCGDFETHLCARCRDSLVPAGFGSCPRCGQPDGGPLLHGRCSSCMGRELSYFGARSCFLHEGAAKRLVADFKFGGQPILGSLMAELAGPEFDSYVASIAPQGGLLATWVPAHRRVQRERGYNQAEVLTRRLLAEHADFLHQDRSGSPRGDGAKPSLGCASLVLKKTSTRHQKGLGKAGRESNLRGAFVLDTVAAQEALECGCRGILLVDDVYTTGATAAEVSRVITAGTGLPVYVFTFSRAVTARSGGHD